MPDFRNQATLVAEIGSMIHSTAKVPPFCIVEVDDEGWAAFKAMEAQHRREYASSPEAVADHEAWVNAPPVPDDQWGSSPTTGGEPPFLPSPTHIPWQERYDWALENPNG